MSIGGGGYSGQVKTEKSYKCQDLAKFEWGGGGYSGQVKTEKSLKDLPKFELQGEVFWASQN